MMSDALKPCPFCGGTPTEETQQWAGFDKGKPTGKRVHVQVVICHGCDISGSKGFWNTRTPSPSAEKLVKSLREAVRLYETWGLIAGNEHCGKWVNEAREALAAHSAECEKGE